MTKVLITGGAGFIGSHVVDLFIQQGCEVVVVDNLSTGYKTNLNPLAKFHHVDIRNLTMDLFAQERPDYVIHHAAQMNVRVSVRNPFFDADVNIMGTLQLLQLCKLFEIKHFIHVSSSAVYGEPEYMPVGESHPINPICEYGVSKHVMEHYLYVYEKNYGLPYTAFRYPNVYGPRQDPNGEAGVIAQFAKKMLAGEPITINGDGAQTRDFVYVSDIARANYLALTLNHPSGVYNLGSGVPTSVNQIFNALRDISDYKLPAKYGPAILGETNHIHLESSKALKYLSWHSTILLEAGLKATLKYFKAHSSYHA